MPEAQKHHYQPIERFSSPKSHAFRNLGEAGRGLGLVRHEAAKNPRLCSRFFAPCGVSHRPDTCTCCKCRCVLRENDTTSRKIGGGAIEPWLSALELAGQSEESGLVAKTTDEMHIDGQPGCIPIQRR